MPKNRRPSDAEEIDSIARMARESRDFYKGLAKTLRPRESRKATVAETGDGTGPRPQDQRE